MATKLNINTLTTVNILSVTKMCHHFHGYCPRLANPGMPVTTAQKSLFKCNLPIHLIVSNPEKNNQLCNDPMTQ
jgi:hypothetical protein